MVYLDGQVAMTLAWCVEHLGSSLCEGDTKCFGFKVTLNVHVMTVRCHWALVAFKQLWNS